MSTKKEDMEKVVVGRGSTFQLEVEVELPGTAIRSVCLIVCLSVCLSQVTVCPTAIHQLLCIRSQPREYLADR